MNGTRCQCSDRECGKSQPRTARKLHHPTLHADLNWQCAREAVRMVTVRRYFVNDAPALDAKLVEVPMCEPCAQYHEAKKAVAR